MSVVPPTVARAAIAAALLEDVPDARLGEITLAPHQLAAGRRIARILDAHGGALLADAVGLGKTFVALAVARNRGRVLIACPAAVRPVWSSALARTGQQACIVTYEWLSRRRRPEGPFDLVILDEAHHARNVSTVRYAMLAELTASATVLLLSATPIVNGPRELRQLLSLFLGERSAALGDDALERLVVRRTHRTAAGLTLPPVEQARWLDPPDDGLTLAALVQLPPAVPAADEGDAGALALYTLVRQWASSRGALVAALRRRLIRATALQQSLNAGRVPTRSEMAAWTGNECAVQLGFAELISTRATPDAVALGAAVAAHASGISALLDTLRARPDPDARRAAMLVELHQRHPGEKVLAFSEYAETVHALWRHLRSRPRTARLTANGGEIASGRMSRTAVLTRFAPEGQRARQPGSIEAIDLLLTTDLLAEGVDLRDATVIVHLDLPWSPVRLEQRVGRARRLGSNASMVTVYAFRPPAAAEALLTVERRVRAKHAAALAAVGADVAPLPDADPPPERQPSDAERRSQVFDRIASWSCQGPAAPRGRGPAVAVVRSHRVGWLAAVQAGSGTELVTRLGERITADAMDLEAAVNLAEGEPTGADCHEIRAALLEAAAWAAERRAEAMAGIGSAATGTVRQRMLARVAGAYLRAPLHRRAAIADLVVAARRAASGRLPAATEHRIASLIAMCSDDETFLEEIAKLSNARVSRDDDASPSVIAMIAFSTQPAGQPSSVSSLSDAELTQ